jgi:hypothetical protein
LRVGINAPYIGRVDQYLGRRPFDLAALCRLRLSQQSFVDLLELAVPLAQSARLVAKLARGFEVLRQFDVVLP